MIFHGLLDLLSNGCGRHAEGLCKWKTREGEVTLVCFPCGLEHAVNQTCINTQRTKSAFDEGLNFRFQQFHDFTSHHWVAQNGSKSTKSLHQL